MQLVATFDVNTNGPISSRTKQDTIELRDAIPEGYRYTGFKCFVESTQTEYILIGGITNTHWQTTGTTATNNISKILGAISDCSIANAIPAGAMLTTIIIHLDTDIESVGNPIINIGETANGAEIFEDYEVMTDNDGWNVISFKKVYTTNKTLYFHGDFDNSTIDFYVVYQQIY